MITETITEDKGIRLFTCELDGKRIAYCSETVFLVQTGKGKSKYWTRHAITGNLAQAIMLYRGYNMGNGYKKRLLVPSFNKPVLARYAS